MNSIRSFILKRAYQGLAMFAVAGALVASAAAQTAPIVMKLGTATINDTQHEWMKIYAGLVEKGSNGRIKAEIYPASQLGAIPRMIEGTQIGSIQVFVTAPEFMSGLDMRFQMLSAAGVFKDIAHSGRGIQDPDFNTAFLALGANKGIKGIGVFLSGPQVINTRTPIRKLADLEGKKLRVLASDMQFSQVRQLKATGVPMALSEVIPALRQGTIDGVFSTIPIFTAMRFYDAAKYIYEPNYMMSMSIAVASKIWFDKLPPDLQKLVADAGQKVSKDIYQWAIDFVAKQREGWIKAGGEITQPTAAEHAHLMKVMQAASVEVTSKKPEEKALFELLQRAAKRTE